MLWDTCLPIDVSAMKILCTAKYEALIVCVQSLAAGTMPLTSFLVRACAPCTGNGLELHTEVKCFTLCCLVFHTPTSELRQRSVLATAGVVYVLDIAYNFRTAFIVVHNLRRSIVRDSVLIAEYYMRYSTFWPDLLAALPLVAEVRCSTVLACIRASNACGIC